MVKKKDFIFSWLILFLVLPIISAYSQNVACKDPESGRWGVRNSKGRVVVPYGYDTVFFINMDPEIYGLGRLLNDTLYAGVIDKKGNPVLPIQFKSVDVSVAGIIAYDHSNFVSLYSLNGILKKKGFYKRVNCSDTNCFIQPYQKWDFYYQDKKATFFADSLALSDSNIMAFRNGNEFPAFLLSYLPISHTDYTQKECNRSDFGKNFKLESDSVFGARFDTVLYYSEGLAAVKSDGSFGFADSSGKIIISVQYEDILPFSEGLAPIKLMGKWGFIDEKENIVIQPYFDSVAVFCQESALIKKDGRINFVDKHGGFRNSKGYQQVKRLPTGNWELREGAKSGLADSAGRELIIPKYAYLKDLGDGFAIVQKHGFFGVLDYKQNIIIPFEYESITSPASGVFFASKVLEKELINISEEKDTRKNASKK